MNTTVQTVKDLVTLTGGKFFTILFIKKDGTTRKMQARIGVKKGLVKSGDARPKAPSKNQDLISVYDVKAKGYRSVDANRVLSIKCGGIEYVAE